ncbi:ubiquitin-conjugating enzyme/RWD-like protein [Neurospora crassa]|nr:ubiquitin-conjugating enzyme/RWD-like protein [Neurospora crassa]
MATSMPFSRMGNLPAVRRQHLLAEFAGLKQACPNGVFVSLTPDDPNLWSGVIFVRKGPYANAVLRFQVSFPDSYPNLPPLVTFSTDMFHPLITPLTTYMYSTDVQHNGTVSATDEERLPPGGFSLRHGFPHWFGRASRSRGERGSGDQRGRPPASLQMTPPPDTRKVQTGNRSEDGTKNGGGTEGTPESTTEANVDAASGCSRSAARRDVSTYEVLRYIRSTFDDANVLDSVPLEAAGNPGAWHAWRTHRRQQAANVTSSPTSVKSDPDSNSIKIDETITSPPPSGTAETSSPTSTSAAPKRPDEWDWDGVWQERVRRGIATSLSEPVLFGNAGAADEVVSQRRCVNFPSLKSWAITNEGVPTDQFHQHGGSRCRRNKTKSP